MRSDLDKTVEDRMLTIALTSGLMYQNGDRLGLAPEFLKTYMQVVKANPINLDLSQLQESALRLADGALLAIVAFLGEIAEDDLLGLLSLVLKHLCHVLSEAGLPGAEIWRFFCESG